MNSQVKTLLTPKQKQVYDFINSFITSHGYSPSYKDIANGLGFKSEGSVAQYLEALENKGFISRGGSSRQIMPFEIGDDAEVLMLGIIPAGKPIEPLENPVSISVPKSMLPSNVACYALKVRGDSMIDDGIMDGDVILIKHQNTANNGDTVVAITEEGATLKRFYKQNGVVRLEPRNPNLKTIYPEQLEIRGKFIGLIRHENNNVFDE
jgi:repressor LexA